LVSLDDFSRLVAGIYGAALTPQTWLSAMNDISSALGAHTASIVVGGTSTRAPKVANISEEAGRAYVEHYSKLDYILEAVERGPVGQLSPTAPLRALNPRSEFDADWMRPNHMDDGLFVRLTHGADTATFLVASSATIEGFATSERIRVVNALVPHLQQALRTEGVLSDAAADTRDVAAAVDSVRHGVVMVSADSEVVHMNSAAAEIFGAADGLCVYKGRIETGRASTSARLARSVGAAAAGRSGVRAGDSLLCTRPSGRRPYITHVVPTEVADPRRPRALVLIVDPETRPEPPREVLHRLYGLTAAETEVAIRVLQGEGVRPIAEQLGVSQATVKTHLQKVFDKTDTHRQAELVRLLLAITAR
jgi:DNA-binding CsgD family transcriptional regulator